MCGENNMRIGTENQIIFYFIRHGKTPGNSEGRYIGTTDEGLSEEGILELKQKKLDVEFEYVFSSPMRRCTESAKILTGKKIETIEAFKEIDFGDFEGKNYKELADNTDYQKWIDSNGTMTFPGGEELSHFKERTVKAFFQIMDMVEARLSDKNQKTDAGKPTRVAVIVHGGTIMAVLERLFLGEYYSYQVKNSEGYVFTVSRQNEKEWQFSDLRRC